MATDPRKEKATEEAIVIVMRHGEKNGDKLTAFGAQQVFAASAELSKRFTFAHFTSSGMNRTNQTIRIAAAAVGVFDAVMEVDDEFNPFDIFSQGGGMEQYFIDLPVIKEKGGTMEAALEISQTARLGREKINKAIIATAARNGNGSTTLVACHSPYSEMGAVDPSIMPYGIGECDAVCYTVVNGVIVSSELIKAPLEGSTNT